MTDVTRAFCLLLTAALGAAGAAAAGAPVPEGCTLEMTVQMRQCQVANYMRCGSDWEVTYSDGKGPFFWSRIDRETRWIESVDLLSGERDRLIEESPDHASFTDLLRTGRDDYDFRTVSSATLQPTTYKGYDRLNGRTLAVGKVTLEESDFDLAAYGADGALLWRRSGTEYIDRARRLFFAGRETFENAEGETVESYAPPMSFAVKGEKGFGAEAPEHDCEVLSTRAAPLALPPSAPIPASVPAPRPGAPRPVL